ncbi:MAG: hypothetical protein LBC19_05820 [Tannerella sp.]|nr:hypothetical protein [Tannerella sp.]
MKSGLPDVLHVPQIVFPGLLRIAVHYQITGGMFFAEDGREGGKQFDETPTRLRHALPVEQGKVFPVIVLPPRKFRSDDYIFDTRLGEERIAQLSRPLIQFVIVVSVHLDPVTAGTFAHIVTEALILQFQRFTDDVAFERVRETCLFAWSGKRDVDMRLPGVEDGRLKLPENLYAPDEMIHLLQKL